MRDALTFKDRERLASSAGIQEVESRWVHRDAIQHIRAEVRAFRAHYGDDAACVLTGHSWGAWDIYDYIKTSPEDTDWIEDHLYVVTLNGATDVPREMCKDSRNLISEGDRWISKPLNRLMRHSDETIFLKPVPGDTGHSCENPTFEQPLEEFYKKIIEENEK